MDFAFVKRMEADRIQRDKRKKARQESKANLTKVKMSPEVKRMIDDENEKCLKEKTPQDKDPVSKKLFFNIPKEVEDVETRCYKERMEKTMDYDEKLGRRQKEHDEFKAHMDKCEAEENK